MTFNPANAFDSLINWFYDDLLVKQGAPGFLVGLSGTDSIVTFLAAAKACEKAGLHNRAMGIHFAPSEDFLADYPESEVHLWFKDQVIPWLRQRAMIATIAVNTSVDWRCDGLRWGTLMDLSVVKDNPKRMMRLPEDQFWVVGTRNRTEDTLLNYSNASMAASIQPIIHLWKSDILQISELLGVPQIAITKSCETDCICGRQALAANHIKEVDMILKERAGELAVLDIEPFLRAQLVKYIDAQIKANSFKKSIPHTPDPLVSAFESGSLNLKGFNHRKHLYVAWYYLKLLTFGETVERYARYLHPLLDAAGYANRFNIDVTRKYLASLHQAMKDYPTDNFDELMDKSGILNVKISA